MEEERMLDFANNLNNEIKNYLNSLDDHPLRDQPGYIHSISSNMLERLKQKIETHIANITNYDFAPRTDRLTKEGVLTDLNMNLDRINRQIAANAAPNAAPNGGKRRKTNRRKTNKKSSRKMRKTIRKRRNMKKRTR